MLSRKGSNRNLAWFVTDRNQIKSNAALQSIHVIPDKYV
jgi:hypothetical protein